MINIRSILNNTLISKEDCFYISTTIWIVRGSCRMQKGKFFMLKLVANKQNSFEYNHLKDNLVKKLALAMIGLNDPYTASHIEEVAELVNKVANKMKLDRKVIKNITLAGFLHDIGKQAIPNSILSKPGELSGEEFALVKTHVDIGVQLLEYAEVSPDIIRIVSEHHERIDGSGYPKGLKGDQISLEGQIIGIADVISAVTSKRTYRLAASKEDVKKILFDPDTKRYDPKLVAVAIECM
jgi:putative nucleotidyltransferase with HDIG domain